MAQSKHTFPSLQESTQPLTTDQIYTLSSAAKVMECSERTLLDKFRGGEIPAQKRMGKWYTKHSSLLQYIS